MRRLSTGRRFSDEEVRMLRRALDAGIPDGVPFPKELSPEMTSQEVFNYVTRCLYLQGRTSRPVLEEPMASKVTCFYRGPGTPDSPLADRLMCGIGWLIPDSLYLSRMEGQSVNNLRPGVFDWSLTDSAYWKTIHGRDRNMLNEIQYIHDNGVDCRLRPGDWRKEFKRIIVALAKAHHVKIYHELYPEELLTI